MQGIPSRCGVPGQTLDSDYLKSSIGNGTLHPPTMLLLCDIQSWSEVQMRGDLSHASHTSTDRGSHHKPWHRLGPCCRGFSSQLSCIRLTEPIIPSPGSFCCPFLLSPLPLQGLCTYTAVPCDGAGLVSIDDVVAALTPNTVLVTVMHSNNEVSLLHRLRPELDNLSLVPCSLSPDDPAHTGRTTAELRCQLSFHDLTYPTHLHFAWQLTSNGPLVVRSLMVHQFHLEDLVASRSGSGTVLLRQQVLETGKKAVRP